jgi:hypothetical protein
VTRQLIVLVDALGWVTAERTGFLRDLLPHRRRLVTVFGYSSTAVPSLLTGAAPVEHGHWFLYRRARGRSPFAEAALVARLPGALTRRWRVRKALQEYWRKKLNIRGYFSLYDIPFEVLAELAPVEVEDTWAAGAFPATPGLLDALAASGLPHHVSDWRVDDEAKIARALAAVEAEDPRVVVLYLTAVDGVQHTWGTRSEALDRQLAATGEAVRRVAERLGRGGPVGITLMSDHGMADVAAIRDVVGSLADAGFRRGRDFRGFLDSTVARFWDVRDAARLAAALRRIPGGRLLPPETLREWDVDFPGGEYGDMFFLADPGVLFVPSDMGRTPLAAMHGYDPAHPDSDACLLSDAPLALAGERITDVLPVLRTRLEEAR